jgi:hypothetical protein
VMAYFKQLTGSKLPKPTLPQNLWQLLKIYYIKHKEAIPLLITLKFQRF